MLVLLLAYYLLMKMISSMDDSLSGAAKNGGHLNLDVDLMISKQQSR